jgi:hypothetical protein
MRARDNPFRTERVLQVRYRLAHGTWAELLSRCESMGYRGAVVGPHGTGKTTLLEDLEPRLHAHGFGTHFLRLSEERSTFAPGIIEHLLARVTDRDILLLDGAEQMDPVRWSWFRWRARKAGGLLISTHQPGRLPTLWECRTTPEVLAGIAAELLETDPGAMATQAEALFRKHRGNLREALREWYDLQAESAAHRNRS